MHFKFGVFVRRSDAFVLAFDDRSIIYIKWCAILLAQVERIYTVGKLVLIIDEFQEMNVLERQS